MSMEEQAKARRAQGRVMLAVERITSRYPFHAALLSRFKVEPRMSFRASGQLASTSGA